jgi:hypothetical protein
MEILQELLQYLPEIIAFIVGIFIPKDKVPILKNILNKTSEAIEQDNEADNT